MHDHESNLPSYSGLAGKQYRQSVYVDGVVKAHARSFPAGLAHTDVLSDRNLAFVCFFACVDLVSLACWSNW